MKSYISLIISILFCFMAALIGSQFMPGEWYADLNKPSWNPPNWIFGPVWTVLYIMMGVSLWLIWKDFGLVKAKPALIVFVVQLTLNALWSYLFFGLQNPFAAFIEIIILWVAIVTTIALFLRLSSLAGALLFPYIVWVTFAAILNFSIWKLNP